MKFRNLALQYINYIIFIIIALKKLVLILLDLWLFLLMITIQKYFKSTSELNNSLALKELSMGMSSDYIEAVIMGYILKNWKFYFWEKILTLVLILSSLTILKVQIFL